MAPAQYTEQQNQEKDLRNQTDRDVIASLATAITMLREENLRLRNASDMHQAEASSLRNRVAQLESMLCIEAPEEQVSNVVQDYGGVVKGQDDIADDNSEDATTASTAEGSPEMGPVRRMREEDVLGAASHGKKTGRKGAPSLLRQVLALHRQSTRPVAAKSRIQQPAMRNFRSGRRN